MYVNKPVPLSNGTAIFEVSLLDETDQGYYVLPPGKQKRCSFLDQKLVQFISVLRRTLPKAP